ncbi:MAG: hypothetical protein TREMPRED_003672 [Tremellales sp. Tagirdzhanova-0007]|nr:MAG: hypothetical protein TREMPRED_003672 [Tremellales sp. Tagirdzhanova-0007]
MPRASRQKAVRRHAAAIQLPSRRSFAVPDHQVIEVMQPSPTSQVPSRVEDIAPSTSNVRKAAKPPASFLVPSAPPHPYSRSHTRRVRRKAREQLAGGQLHSVAAALSEVLPDTDPPSALKRMTRVEREAKERKLDDARRELSKIGIGKGRTLTERARRKQIKIQAKRIPAIMQHPEYRKDPWATIRLHASNSVAAKDAPSL